MGTLTKLDAESGTDGTTVTAANFPFTQAPTIAGTGVIFRFDSTAALLGLLGWYVKAISGSQDTGRVAVTSSKVQRFRFLFRLRGTPGIKRNILIPRGSGVAMRFKVDTSRQLCVSNASDASEQVGSALTVGVIYECSGTITVGTTTSNGSGTIKVRQWDGWSQVGSDITLTGYNLGTTAIAAVDVGVNDSAAGGIEYDFDSVLFENDVATEFVTQLLAADGTGQSTGQASVSALVGLVANGASQTAGEATLARIAPVAADGSGSTSGSAEMLAVRTVAGDGAGSTSSNASIVRLAPLAADGVGATSGSAEIAALTTLVADGLGSTAGSAAIAARRSLAADGSGSTAGSAEAARLGELAADGSGLTSASAELRAVATLAADGSGQTSGSAELEQPAGTDDLQADGAGATSGSAALVVIGGVRADGVTQSTGDASLGAVVRFEAAGAAQLAGSAELRALAVLVADGYGFTSGQASLIKPGASQHLRLAGDVLPRRWAGAVGPRRWGGGIG